VAALELSPLLFLKHIPVSLLLRLAIVLTERIKILLTLRRVQNNLRELRIKGKKDPSIIITAKVASSSPFYRYLSNKPGTEYHKYKKNANRHTQ
jgi:hypothetical protein